MADDPPHRRTRRGSPRERDRGYRGEGRHTPAQPAYLSEDVDQDARRALPLLASEVNRALIAQLSAAGRITVGELNRRLYPFSSRTLLEHRGRLTDLGLLTRDEGGTSRTVVVGIAPRGASLENVRRCVMQCLRRRPESPVEADGKEVSAVVAAVVEGLHTGILQRFAHGPCTVADLERQRLGVRKAVIDRVLVALVGAGLLSHPDRGPYSFTPWGRLLVTPIVAATRWDRAGLPEGADPITVGNAAEVLMIALGRVRLRDEDSGVCQLTIKPQRVVGDPAAGGGARGGQRTAQVYLVIERGEIVSCTATPPAKRPTSWASGSPFDWYHAVVERHLRPLQVGDGPRLVENIVRRLHDEFIRNLGIDPHHGRRRRGPG